MIYMTHYFVPFGSMDITQFLEDRKPLFKKSRRRKLSRLNQKESRKLHLKKRVHSQLEENVLFRKLIAHHNFFTRTHFIKYFRFWAISKYFGQNRIQQRISFTKTETNCQISLILFTYPTKSRKLSEYANVWYCVK